MQPIIAIIGSGNMGASLIGGLIRNGYSPLHIWCTDPSREKLDHVSKEFHIHTTSQNEEAILYADVVILAIKPQIFAEAVIPLHKIIQERKPLIISIAAGIDCQAMQKWMGHTIPIIRAMPNTPALYACGATGLFANSNVTTSQKQLAETIMKSVGITVWVEDESDINIITALSGSGPAYFFFMMEAMQKAADEMGLSSEIVRKLTVQTAYGAAKMALESKESLTELRLKVTSPGGTTEKAIAVMEENHLRDIYKRAMFAAKLRSEELAKLLGEKS